MARAIMGGRGRRNEWSNQGGGYKKNGEISRRDHPPPPIRTNAAYLLGAYLVLVERWSAEAAAAPFTVIVRIQCDIVMIRWSGLSLNSLSQVFFIDNLLVRIHCIIVMIRTGLSLNSLGPA